MKNRITINALILAAITMLAVSCKKDYETLHAELVDGESFNSTIPANVTTVVFECNNSSVRSGVSLSSPSSPVPVFGIFEGQVLRVITWAGFIDANPNSGKMFYNRSKLTSIDFGKGFNTSNVTDMSEMFQGCSKLTALDVSNFNTSNVTDMSEMFQGCSKLTALDVSSFNTSNVNSMAAMFKSCSGLTGLDVSSFRTSNVTDMHDMFRGCNKLTSLNVSSFNTSNVKRMDAMFYGCSGLTSLDVSNFNTSNVVRMTRTVDTVLNYYTGYSSGEEVQIPESNKLIRFGMFAQCSSLTSLDLSSFNTSQVTDMRGLFEGCKKLTSLNVSSFNTSNVKYMDGMFKDCSSLTSLDLTNFNTSNVVSMGTVHRFFYNWGSAGQYGNYRYEANGGMFENCTGLTSLDLSNFNTSNVTRMYNMFNNCTHLTYLNLSIFDMSHLEVTDYDITYTGKEEMCWKLASASGSCTIVCTQSVQNSLLNGTSIPAGQVTFTWVRPTSK